MVSLAAIDIGNTTIALAVFKGGKIIREYHIKTALKISQLEKRLAAVLRAVENTYGLPEKAAICSVVPEALKVVEKSIEKGWGKQAGVIGRDIIIPIKNNYKNPRQVGQDRLVCAYAARKLYGTPAIVIDFGTAITFDVVSAKGEYEGGLIVPGIRLSAESLFHKTALLPRIELMRKPRQLIGKNTRESILSGIFYGYGAMAGGLINQIAKGLKGRPRVILTGGYTDLMRQFMSVNIDTIDRHLVYKGIYFCCHLSSAPKKNS